MSYIPQPGDTGVTGTVTSVGVAGGVQYGGIVYADQIQGEEYSQYSGPSNEPNPLRFPFSGDYGVVCGQRVTFSVFQAPFAPAATDLQPL